MAQYNSGSVQVKVGSANVRGYGTSFTTYVSAGNYFRVIGDTGFYDIASVNSATKLTLTSRYSDSNHHTSRSGYEASTNNATQVYSGTLSYTPVIQNYVVLNASNVRFTDDGAGVLTGTPTTGTPVGTIDYDTGAWTLNLAATYSASVDITSSYYSGDTLNAMTYQVVKDFTSHFSLPEMSKNDTNFQDIYTRAMRLIDSALYNIDTNTVTASSLTATTATIKDLTVTGSISGNINGTLNGNVVGDVSGSLDGYKTKVSGYYQMGDHQYMFFGSETDQASIEAAATSIDASCKGSLYLSSGGTMWFMITDDTATSVSFN